MREKLRETWNLREKKNIIFIGLFFLFYVFYSIWRGFSFFTFPGTDIFFANIGVDGLADKTILIPYGSRANEFFLYFLVHPLINKVIPDMILSTTCFYFVVFAFSYFSTHTFFLLLGGNKWIAFYATVLWLISPIFLSQVGIQPVQMAMLFLPINAFSDLFIHKVGTVEVATLSLRKSVVAILFIIIARGTLVFSSWYVAVVVGFTECIFFSFFYLLKIEKKKLFDKCYIFSFLLFFIMPWVVAGMVGMLLTPSGTAGMRESMDIFRGGGVDLITIILPRKGQFLSGLFSFENVLLRERGLTLPGDSSMWNNYLGYFLVGSVFIGVIKSKNKTAAACFGAGLVCFILALGPGLKALTTIPATSGITYGNYLLDESQVVFDFPWKAIFSFFPFSMMRAVYRWLITPMFLLIMGLVWLCRKQEPISKKTILILFLIFLEFVPHPTNTNWKHGVSSRELIENLKISVVEPLAQYGIQKEDRVLFVDLSSGNDFLTAYISKQIGFKTYNGGGDKSMAVANLYMPKEVRALKNIGEFSFNSEQILKNIQELREKNLCEYVVVPFFSLRWASYPNSFDFQQPQYKDAAGELIDYISGNSDLKYEIENTFCIINIKNDESTISQKLVEIPDYNEGKDSIIVGSDNPYVIESEVIEYDKLYLSFMYEAEKEESVGEIRLQFLNKSGEILLESQLDFASKYQQLFFENDWSIPSESEKIIVTITSDKKNIVIDNLYSIKYNMDEATQKILDTLCVQKDSHKKINGDTFNLSRDDRGILFTPGSNATIQDFLGHEPKVMEFGLNLKINDFTDNTVEILAKKGLGWPNDVSFVYGWNSKDIYLIFSENGFDIDGVWLSRDTIRMEEWTNVKVRFENGTIKYYMDNQLIAEKKCELEKIYPSNQPIVLGGNFVGAMGDFYVFYE